jgi:DNA-binding transcriptional LysR family regulator
MHFSSDSLQTFIKVAEERSFSVAAKKLHKSQSSVSSQVTLLEDQCGMKLFHRSPRPLRLTQAGLLLLDFAKEVANRTQELSASLTDLKEGIAGEVRIGAITSITTFLLPSLVRTILHNFKNLRVTISAQNVSQLCESVRTGELDLAIILSDQEPGGLSASVLRTETFYCVVAPDHAAAGTTQLGVKMLGNYPLIMGQESSSYTQMLTRLLRKKGVSRYEVAARISTLEGMKEITRTGIGIGILPEYIVERDIRRKTLTRLRLKGGELHANIYLVENVRSVETATLVAVKNLIVTSMTRSARSRLSHEIRL